MNYAKIAAALHALADAFLEGGEDQPAPAKGKGKKGSTNEQTAANPAAAAATAVAQPAAEPLKTLEPYVEPKPALPTIDKAKLNAAVLKVAAKSRDTAEAILGRFGAKNTVTLPEDKWQAVFDAFEEEIARMDAAAVQVQPASLV